MDIMSIIQSALSVIITGLITFATSKLIQLINSKIEDKKAANYLSTIINSSASFLYNSYSLSKISNKLTEESLKRAHKYQDELNSFVTIIDDAKESEVTDNVLSGIPCAIKDNFSTKDVLTTASSNILSR